MKTINTTRARIWARFPRLSYWAGQRRVRFWVAMGYLALLLSDVANGKIPARWMYLPAAVIALLAVCALIDAGMHAATCPCVTDPTWNPESEDQAEGGE